MSSEDKFDADKFSQDLHDRIHENVHERIQDAAGKSGRVAIRARLCGKSNSALWPGVILVIVGTAILLDHMGILSIERIWLYWPAILIVAGIFRFFESCNQLFSIVLMLVGGLLLIANLGYIRLTWAELWPALLIAAGISMIWGKITVPRTATVVSGGSADRVTATAMFGGVERRVTTSNFSGGTATAIFGGVEIDFRSADIAGEEAVLHVDALFGGIEIVVPDRWMAIYEGQSIFGGFNDETREPLPDVAGTAPRKRLVLRGQAMFGGITVKS